MTTLAGCVQGLVNHIVTTIPGSRFVAAAARDTAMRSLEFIGGVSVMIKPRCHPALRRVTVRAIGREAIPPLRCRNRFELAVVCVVVAGGARLGERREITLGSILRVMACAALDLTVAPQEGIVCLVVIELHLLPACIQMTRFASAA